jgi:hypothetical protein
LYIVGNEFGAIAAVTALDEGSALDQLINSGLGDSLLVDPQPTHEDADVNEYRALGNACEYCDLTYAWIAEVSFDPARDIDLIVAIAKADGAGESTLDKS